MNSSGTSTAMAPCVRYACRCGHWAPLGRMFFSDLCHKLVCRRASCSVEEFESYYCAYLLVNLPSKEANLYQNRSSRCFACVACGSVLSTVFHDARRKFFFACAHCHWDSLDVGLLEDDPDTLLKTAVARERETDHEDLFHTLLSHHATLAAANSASSASASARGGVSSSAAAMGRRLSLAAAGRSSSLQSLAGTMKELQREQQMKKFRLQRMAEMGTWKYEHALERVHERAQWLEAQRHEHEWPELKQQLAQFSELEAQDDDGDRALEAVAAQGDMDAVSALPQRLLMPLEQPRDAKQLFPHRPLLRVKRTWRCVESIKRGSAGILVKPQISPMSGDSSLPVPASWFKKANLGVHFVPIFTFQMLPKRVAASTAEGGLARFDCVLLIENPLDTPVQLVCQPGDGDAHHAKVLLEDATPIVLGAYEDPTIADAFAGDSRSNSAEAGASGHNRHLVSTVRNLAKFRVPLEVSPNAPDNEITFRLQVEMLKIDEALQEPIMDSLFSLAVEFSSPLVAVSA